MNEFWEYFFNKILYDMWCEDFEFNNFIKIIVFRGWNIEIDTTIRFKGIDLMFFLF